MWSPHVLLTQCQKGNTIAITLNEQLLLPVNHVMVIRCLPDYFKSIILQRETFFISEETFRTVASLYRNLSSSKFHFKVRTCPAQRKKAKTKELNYIYYIFAIFFISSSFHLKPPMDASFNQFLSYSWIMNTNLMEVCVWFSWGVIDTPWE